MKMAQLPCLATVLVAGVTPPLLAGPLQLVVESPPVGGSLTLQVRGASGPQVTLEGSFDLAEWFSVESATVSNGAARFTWSSSEPLAGMFFRVEETAPAFDRPVGPQPDPLRSTAGLITPEAGGQLSLTAPDGVVCELRVDADRVWEPVLARMTWITNFTVLPLGATHRAAVMLEPDGLEFRGTAELRLRFPGPIPAFEMVGYGFAGDGTGFQLTPWQVRSNEVVIPLAHFSGAGVAAEPFPPTGNFIERFDQAWRSTRDARRVADQWASEELRENSRLRQRGLLSQEEFERQLETIRKARDRKEYRLGIQPLLAAAEQDCAVGQVLLHRLDQLAMRAMGAGEPYFSGDVGLALSRLYSPVRCRCAHYYLDLCEQNPQASGRAITAELTQLLQDLELIYGLSGDPTCDLGSNQEILERLRRGPCHRPWEGSVRYTFEETENWVTGTEGSSATKRRRLAMTFVARVTEVLEQDGDPDPEFNWEWWRLRLQGRLTASLDDEDVQVIVAPDYFRSTETAERKGRFDQQVKGELSLRFEMGQPETVVVSTGLEDVTYPMPRILTTETVVECWKTPPPCPESKPRLSRSDGNETLHFAFGDIPRDVKVLSWQNGELQVVFEHIERFQPIPGFRDYVNERIERMTVRLWRAR